VQTYDDHFYIFWGSSVTLAMPTDLCPLIYYMNLLAWLKDLVVRCSSKCSWL